MDFVLNSNGVDLIDIDGFTKFSLRESSYDAPNIEPEWAADDFSGFITDDHTLIITYEVYNIVVNPTALTPYNYLIEGLEPDESIDWGLQFLAPTEWDYEGNEKTGNITLTAEAS
jgi:hypothetical protein